MIDGYFPVYWNQRTIFPQDSTWMIPHTEKNMTNNSTALYSISLALYQRAFEITKYSSYVHAVILLLSVGLLVCINMSAPGWAFIVTMSLTIIACGWQIATQLTAILLRSIASDLFDKGQELRKEEF